MVIHGLGKTRMFGNSIQVIEDFMNITECVREGFTYRYDRETADELIVDCIRVILLEDPDKRKQAEKDLAKVMMSIAEA